MTHQETNRSNGRGSAPLARIALLSALAVGAFAVPARAEPDLGAWIDSAKPLVDLRARYEGVDDASKSVQAAAYTLRARLGVQTGSWNGLSALAEFDQLWDLNDQFNSTRNGRTAYPLVADPQMTALNRLQLDYAGGWGTNLTVGRERILIGDQRFVGNSGWRQHEQTFDAATLSNRSVPGLTASYSYIDRVNRVYGPDAPKPATGATGAFHCDCHLIDVTYAGLPNITLEGFGFLLDLSQENGPVAAKTAVRKLSTATFGADSTYQVRLDNDVSARLFGEYAHQSNYRDNPLSFDLDYWRGEAGGSFDSLTGLVGYESMQGNGTVGFSTPLATIHSFDGWADMFLTTPANGLNDLYVKGILAPPSVAHALHIDSANATLVYRNFTTTRTGTGIGTEWDGALEFRLDGTSLLLQYADYRGAGIGLGGFADKSIGWVQLAYKY